MMDKAPEFLSGEMSVMDASGHKQLTWKMDKPDEIATARTTFDRLVEKGYSAFGARKKTEPKHAIKTFDPTMEELVLVPRTVGG